jgi:TatD DNase family protein
MYIDVHAHLDTDFYDEKAVASLVKRAEKAGVEVIVANGTHKNANRYVMKLAKKYPSIKAALGIYPYEALLDDVDAEHYPKDVIEFDIDEELDFIRKNANHIVALGEVGLDLKTKREGKKQFAIFEKIVKLAIELDKPLIVHSRKAEVEVMDTLEKLGAKKVVMHCFCGKKKLWDRIKANGWYCSIPTNCVRSDQFKSLIRFMPLTQLFCETDSPFLSPFKEKKNEPAFVVESYKVIAAEKELELKEVENAIWQNWNRLFL